jgi:hypothetical protein
LQAGSQTIDALMISSVPTPIRAITKTTPTTAPAADAAFSTVATPR